MWSGIYTISHYDAFEKNDFWVVFFNSLCKFFDKSRVNEHVIIVKNHDVLGFDRFNFGKRLVRQIFAITTLCLIISIEDMNVIVACLCLDGPDANSEHVRSFRMDAGNKCNSLHEYSQSSAMGRSLFELL